MSRRLQVVLIVVTLVAPNAAAWFAGSRHPAQPRAMVEWSVSQLPLPTGYLGPGTLVTFTASPHPTDLSVPDCKWLLEGGTPFAVRTEPDPLTEVCYSTLTEILHEDIEPCAADASLTSSSQILFASPSLTAGRDVTGRVWLSETLDADELVLYGVGAQQVASCKRVAASWTMAQEQVAQWLIYTALATMALLLLGVAGPSFVAAARL